MTTGKKTRNELLAENDELRQRLEEAEETLRAIQSGEVDALVVSRPEGEQIFTLQGAEMPYRVLVESMNEGAANLAADGTILYCNRRLAAMLQLPLERLIGTRLASYVAPADRTVCADRMERCAEKSERLEIALIPADGNLLPVLFSCSAMKFQGCPGIGAVFTDIRARKEAEALICEVQVQTRLAEERERAAESLRDAAARLKADLDAMTRLQDLGALSIQGKDLAMILGEIIKVAIDITAADFGNIQILEEETRRLKIAAQQGFPKWWVDFWDGVNEGVGACGTALQRDRRIIVEDVERSPIFVGTPGLDIQLQAGVRAVQSTPLVARSGKMIGMFSTHYRTPHRPDDRTLPLLDLLARQATDIIVQARGEEALRKLNEELEERIAQRTAELRDKDQMLIMQSRQAAMGEMLENIAHQWRQPLHSVGIVMQTLTLMHDDGELNRENLVAMERQVMELVQHMSRTIDDFRNYFRPDREKVLFHVGTAVQRTLSLVEASFKDRLIAIDVRMEDDPVIHGFQNEYSQVLLNILQNARDALESRKVNNPLVTVVVGSENGKSAVTISDNAGGIPDEIIDKVFDPYFTTKGPDKGTGIGLFMSKSIIEKNMDGRLTVRNTCDGAEFRIEL